MELIITGTRWPGPRPATAPEELPALRVLATAVDGAPTRQAGVSFPA